MLDKMTDQLGFHSKALVLRAERQRVIASNIANADTPLYVARDFDFRAAMEDALTNDGSRGDGRSDSRHLALPGLAGNTPKLGYAVQSQPSLDQNTVDLDRERANFVDNAVRYEATLRFINGQAKTLLSAIQGQ